MTDEPTLVPRDALRGQRIAISVSASPDLLRLGLSELHLKLTVAELSRAIVIAGGIVVYGGSIDRGFTATVIEEAQRYGSTAGAFEHYVPYSEQASHQVEDLITYANSLNVKSTVYLLDAAGTAHAVNGGVPKSFVRKDLEPALGLTAMRRLTSEVASARVIVGGKVAGFAGSIPGVAEEAACTIKYRKSLYVAGGFGGAATLVGSILTPAFYEWLPDDLPAGLTADVRDSVSRWLDATPAGNGLTPDEQEVLAMTYRPSDIATLTVLGLARQVGGFRESG